MSIRPTPIWTSEEKVALFMKLFRGRADVFPNRWENVKRCKKRPNRASLLSDWRFRVVSRVTE